MFYSTGNQSTMFNVKPSPFKFVPWANAMLQTIQQQDRCGGTFTVVCCSTRTLGNRTFWCRHFRYRRLKTFSI